MRHFDHKLSLGTNYWPLIQYNIFSASPLMLVDSSIDYNVLQLVMLLQHADIVKWIPVDQNTVGVETWLNFSQFVLLHEQFGHARCRRQDGLHRGKAEELDEVLEIPGVGAVRSP